MKKCILFMLIPACFLISCGGNNSNKLTSELEKEGWKLLFDGESLTGWHGYNGGMLAAWDVEDGAIICGGSDMDKTDRRVDLVTDKKYRNFEFSVDWKISQGSNSGIIYLMDESQPAAWMTGPEYQIIDDEGFPEKLEDWQMTGANYAMHPPVDVAINPVGEWNNSVIIVNNGNVQHWLNGAIVVEYELWTDEWEELKTNGKWKDYPTYGTVKEGFIALQDHGSPVHFRNIMIKEL